MATESTTQQYAEVLLPLNIQGSYTYSVPPTMQGIAIGSRVLVSFGRRKFYTAIVVSLHCSKPQGYEVKEISAMLDNSPIIKHPQLKFWQWISDYYLCTLGDVYKAAIPSGLKVESETFISVNPDYEETQEVPLTEREKIMLDFTAQRTKVQLSEIANATGFKNIATIAAKLLEKDAIHVVERVIDNYRPKTETYVTLTLERNDSDGLHKFFDDVKRAKKQEALLLAFLDLSQWLQPTKPAREISKAELLKRADVTATVLSAAVQKGLFKLYKKEINRFASIGDGFHPLPRLSEAQQSAYAQINQSFHDKNITLLHGVTSSGKTQIYMHLINDALKRGTQALYLVPEIALTTQLTQRLRQVFGDKLLIYHSKFSDNERVDIWKRLLSTNEPCVVIGVRSAVFLPFSKLGLVIVDEEHESSYKQQDPAPRYNGRDAALVLSQMHGAKSLLGSATPTIETYHKAQSGKYGFVELLTRYEDIELPVVEVLDTKLARKKREMKGLFSDDLISQCRTAVKNGEQAILFQNRRGYAPIVECSQCGWVPRCDNCDVSLTYHKHINTLSCHYCGHTMTLPNVCPVCGNASIEILGYGTERIEDEIEKIFPDARIARMDLDTTRNKNSYEKIINEFSAHKADILIGTQMVTKGLDFDGVSIVGILNADTIISFPDFRSHERAFNMLEQVAGRAGRKQKRGKVVVQTANPSHPVVKFLTKHDYKSFFKHELAEREQFAFPPFTKIINIYLKHRDCATVNEMAVRFSGLLRQAFKHRVLGPEAPLVSKIQNFHIQQIVLKMENEASMTKVKTILRQIYEYSLTLDSRMKQVIIYYDVDPV